MTTLPVLNDCRHCAHLHRERESWEMPHIFWYECTAQPGMENLRSFPFKATKCTKFKQREKPVKKLFEERIAEMKKNIKVTKKVK